MDLKLFSKLAPKRSILFIKQILGTPYSSAYLQFVSLCGSTPATPSNTTTAPSKTRNDLFTSTVKSMYPGVSIILNRYFLFLSSGAYVGFQKHVIAALVIVMPRSFSCSIQSVVASPSCTSPILWLMPV